MEDPSIGFTEMYDAVFWAGDHDLADLIEVYQPYGFFFDRGPIEASGTEADEC